MGKNIKYEIVINHKMTRKFKNNIQGILSFVFSIDDNTFYTPKLKILKDSSFSIPASKHVSTYKQLEDKTTLSESGIRRLLTDVEITDNVTVALNTVFSQNVSANNVFFTNVEGLNIKIPFIQSLFNNNKTIGINTIISSSKSYADFNNKILVTNTSDFNDVPNLLNIFNNKKPEFNTPKRINVKKFESKFTRTELNSILISFLTGKSFRSSELLAGIERENNNSRDGHRSLNIIKNYWGLSSQNKGSLLGYSNSWIMSVLEKDKSKTSLTKLLKNSEESNIQRYISETFQGGDFLATSGYVSLPLLLEFIEKMDDSISSLIFGIGDIDLNRINKSYTTNIKFNLNDPSSFPKYNIISNMSSAAEMIRGEKYRFFTNEKKFLHAKSYYYNEQLIVGSSNFTFNGSNSGNFELSIVTDEEQPKSDYKEWFSQVIKDSKNIKKDVINMADASSSVTPSEIIASKVIDKLVSPTGRSLDKSLKLFKESSEEFNVLYDYQQVAFDAVVKGLEDNNVFMLADEVGLGKTPVALVVMEYFKWKHGYSTVVLGPKNIVENVWDSLTLEDDNPFEKSFDFTTVSISEFSSKKQRKTEKWFSNKKLIVIDESHYFRNVGNDRTDNYKALIDRSVSEGAKVLLLTATPIFNTYMDLFNQFNLGKKSLDQDGIYRFFKSLDSAKNPVDKIRESDRIHAWLSERFLSRSKKYIKNAFKRDPRMSLPDLEAKNINSKVDPIQSEIINDIDHSFNGKSAHIMKFMLAKRLEESYESFNSSLNSIIKSYLNNNFDDIKKWVKNELTENNLSENDYFEDVYLKEEKTYNFEIDVKNVNLILDKTSKLSIIDTDKFKNLKEVIELESRDGIAIFTTSQQTAKALYDNILREYPNLKIGAISGNFRYTNSELVGSIKSDEDIATLFSPGTMSGKVKQNFEGRLGEFADYKLDILIMTDKFAEGLNLQENKTVINFDFPWSPMIVQQRVGRLNRARSSHKVIKIYNLWPSEELDKKIKMWSRSIGKQNKASSIQDLPNIFRLEYEKYGITFSDPIENNNKNESLQDNIILRDEKLIAKAKISPGWYTTISGAQDEVFNLFRVGNDYFFLSSSRDKVVNNNSLRNLNIVNKYVNITSNQISLEEHLEYIGVDYYHKVFTPELIKQIDKLKEAKTSSEEVELIATIFIVSQESW